MRFESKNYGKSENYLRKMSRNAQRMGVNQAATSKLESREGTHVGTLKNYIRALGGRLVMRAAFDDLDKEIELVGAE